MCRLRGHCIVLRRLHHRSSRRSCRRRVRRSRVSGSGARGRRRSEGSRSAWRGAVPRGRVGPAPGRSRSRTGGVWRIPGRRGHVGPDIRRPSRTTRFRSGRVGRSRGRATSRPALSPTPVARSGSGPDGTRPSAAPRQSALPRATHGVVGGSSRRRRRHHRRHSSGGGHGVAPGRRRFGGEGRVPGHSVVGRFARSTSRLTLLTAAEGSSSTSTPCIPRFRAASTFDSVSSRKATLDGSTPSREALSR